MIKKLSELYGLHILKELIGQDRVVDFLDPNDGLPNDPEFKDRYISTSSANDWLEDFIYEWDGEKGFEITPQWGTITLVHSDNKYYFFDNIQWKLLDELIDHNTLDGIQGSSDGYHLQSSAYDNLKDQDQEVYTTSTSTLNDLTITNPSNIYDLSHDSFTNVDASEHRQGENSITQNIHDDNITSSSVTQHEANIDHQQLTNVHQDVYTDSNPEFAQIKISNSITDGLHVTTKDYVDGLIQGLNWQRGVIDFYDPSTSLPASASDGDRYIASDDGNGGTINNIYEYENDSGVETVVEDGFAVGVYSDDRKYVYQTSEGVKFGETINHNNTSGLQGGDGNERYHLKSAVHDNLKDQDQKVYTTSSPTFDDISITNPIDIYGLSHDSFTDYDSDEHIDHSTLELSAGHGLSGGGYLTSSKTIDLDAVIDDLNDVDATGTSDRYGLLWNDSTSKGEAKDINPDLNAAYIDTYTGDSVIVPHNLSVPNVFVTTYDDNNVRVEPTNVEILNDDEVLIEFDSSTTFTAVIMEPGAPIQSVLSLINFKGTWSDSLSGSGGLETPASTYHDNKFWVLLNDVDNVGDHEPGVSSEWVTIYDGIDDVLSSAAGTGLIYESSTETMHLSASIGDLKNVDDSGVEDGNGLFYNSDTGQYEPGGGGITRGRMWFGA